MKIARWQMAGLALFVAAGTALAEPELNGRWRATFATQGNEDRQATVTIDGLKGSWRTHARDAQDSRDPCIGREWPLVLSDSGSSTVSLRIEASKVVPACKDRQARLTLVDLETMEGEFSNGRVLRLVRPLAGQSAEPAAPLGVGGVSRLAGQPPSQTVNGPGAGTGTGKAPAKP